MIWPVYLFYCTCVAFIRIYKWTELQVLKPFKPILKRKGKQLAESIGVVLHCPGDGEWTAVDTERVLSKCEKYDKLLHLKVHDPMFFVRVANTGSLGLFETYVEKMWDFIDSEEDLTVYGIRLTENRLLDLYYNRWNRFLQWLELYAFNLQTKKRASKVVGTHYDIGNDLYEMMLGSTMQYTCAYYKDAKDLNSAQIAKMDLLAKKLDLKPGMRVLDMGCGWGTLCKYLAENYKVECVGVNLAEEGIKYGKEVCQGLPVELRHQDYRKVNEKFDRIVSVGLLEHVGEHNYSEFFKVVDRCLVEDGIFVLHNIGIQQNYYHATSDPFSDKYIFPNGQIPTVEGITKASRKRFVVEDWHNFGQDYAKTLYAWRENFLRGWPQLQGKNYDEKFYRMWITYLSFARSFFSSRTLQLWQVVFSKKGLRGDYRAAR